MWCKLSIRRVGEERAGRELKILEEALADARCASTSSTFAD